MSKEEGSQDRLRLKCLGCEVLARPLYRFAAESPHVVDVELLERGLHERADGLREVLQERIGATSDQTYDAIILAYGLCGKATAGLKAVGLPIVIPRVHDCITLFLGSRKRYEEEFSKVPGTFWYVQDYVERDDGRGLPLSAGTDGHTEAYEGFVEKYGEDNAAYLMETLGGWQSHYSRAAYIELGFGEGRGIEERARAEALKRGWEFTKLEADTSLVKKLVFGAWDGDFLIARPGQTIQMTTDGTVLLVK